MPENEYRSHEAIAASDLSIFEVNPSLYLWQKEAPRDPKNSAAADFGSALHLAVLEPEKFDDQVIVSDLKTKTAKAFVQQQIENPDKYILTEGEAEQIRFLVKSARANPMIHKMLSMDGSPEVSLFSKCSETGLQLKIRVDWLINYNGEFLPCNLKSTADLSKWRKNQSWVNPLFEFNYGFSAAFYMHAMRSGGMEVNEHPFICYQKSAQLGRYPASVFTVTWAELENLGFVERVKASLQNLKECQENNALFLEPERFGDFGIDENQIIDCSILDSFGG